MKPMMRFANADPRPVRTLWWCALAIAISFVVLSIARTRLSKEPDRVFAVESLQPAAQFNDSWLAMNTAFNYLRSPHSTPVYTKVFIQDHMKFQYPLTSLLPLYVVRGQTALNTISLVLILLTCPVMVVLFNRFLTMASPTNDAGGPISEPLIDRIGRIALPLLMMLTFYPLINAYRLGQLQSWLFAGFMLMVWLWMDKRYIAAGLLAGLLTCGKPQFGLLLIWAATRRKWSFCGAFLVVALAAGLISLALFGITENLDYLNVLAFLSRHGESWWWNQSVNGLLNRAIYLHGAFTWNQHFLPPYNPVVYYGTILSSLALIAGGLFVPARFRGGIADLLLASLTCTIASPVAWIHHYTILLPVFAAMFAWSATVRPLGRWTLPVLCISYTLVGTYQGAFWKLALSRFNYIQSYPLAGVLIALFVLYVWVIRGEPGGAFEPSGRQIPAAHAGAERAPLPQPLAV